MHVQLMLCVYSSLKAQSGGGVDMMAPSFLSQHKCSLQFISVCKCALWDIPCGIFIPLGSVCEEGVWSDLTEGRCFHHSVEDACMDGGRNGAKAGLNPFSLWRLGAFFTREAAGPHSRYCTASVQAAALEMEALFSNL